MTPEFSRPLDADTVSESPRTLEIGADEAERRKLAGRFRLVALDRLAATVTLARRAGIIHADGRVMADLVQSCVVTGEPLPAHIDAPFSVRYVPETPGPAGEEEVELSEEDCDTLPLENGRIDLGELAAETLALALDPYPRAPDADLTLDESDTETDTGPFAALKALKDRMEKGA
ncbi:YceD family protein [Sphingomonas tabacisoli]|uniref:YceD family protein n=1 Tax=Sphingomonas tabacisoli TaxID=2249466 RepID=A0ABW4HZL0_9SPHN